MNGTAREQPTFLARFWRWEVLLLTALIALGADFVGGGRPPVPTATGTEFSVSVPKAGCSTAGSDTACEVTVGKAFSVEVTLHDLELPNSDRDARSGYTGLQVTLAKGGPSVSFLESLAEEVVWPDCYVPTQMMDANKTTFGCPALVGIESTFTGVVVRTDVRCDAAGEERITLSQGPPVNSHVMADDGLTAVGPAAGTQETLTLNCTR